MENIKSQDFKRYVVAILFLCLLLVGCSRESEPLLPMEVSVFGLGRADSILITTENHAVMIDTGKNRHGEDIVNYLLSQNITSLDYLIITHFDRDHVGGAHHIIDAIDVQTVIVPNYSRESRHVSRLNRAMADANLTAFVLTEPLRLTLDGAEFIVDPTLKPYFAFGTRNDNPQELDGDNFSIVVSITHGDNAFLFTGDARSRRMREILRNGDLMRIDFDFLKIPRHGRHMSRSDEFIETVSPRYAVITDSYEDPAQEELLDILDAIDAQVFFARQNGVRATSDGIEITVVYEDFFELE